MLFVIHTKTFWRIFNQWEIWGTESSSNLSKVTQHIGGGARNKHSLMSEIAGLTHYRDQGWHTYPSQGLNHSDDTFITLLWQSHLKTVCQNGYNSRGNFFSSLLFLSSLWVESKTALLTELSSFYSFFFFSPLFWSTRSFYILRAREVAEQVGKILK